MNEEVKFLNSKTFLKFISCCNFWCKLKNCSFSVSGSDFSEGIMMHRGNRKWCHLVTGDCRDLSEQNISRWKDWCTCCVAFPFPLTAPPLCSAGSNASRSVYFPAPSKSGLSRVSIRTLAVRFDNEVEWRHQSVCVCLQLRSAEFSSSEKPAAGTNVRH